MARPDKISRFLPINFANGIKVRRFAKHCPRCGNLVSAESMHGIASLLENRIFVSAKAHCPECRKQFSIACVITDDRNVHRVMAPDWMFALWLRMTVRNLPQPVQQNEWELADDAQPAALGLVLNDSGEIVHSGEILGRFDGTAISSWIEYHGQRYHFERAVQPGAVELAADQILFDGKLIYQLKA